MILKKIITTFEFSCEKCKECSSFEDYLKYSNKKDFKICAKCGASLKESYWQEVDEQIFTRFDIERKDTKIIKHEYPIQLLFNPLPPKLEDEYDLYLNHFCDSCMHLYMQAIFYGSEGKISFLSDKEIDYRLVKSKSEIKRCEEQK